jgi:hypothetical protein
VTPHRADYVLADRLNRECFCIGTDVAALHDWLSADLAGRGLMHPVTQTHPYLFSELPVFVSRQHVQGMQHVIDAVESVVGLPAYRAAALSGAPPIARHAPAAHGVLQGYDFHLTVDGPKLIEINTNAGGAMLNAVLGRAQRACCRDVADLMTGPCDFPSVEERVVEMFTAEWRRARGDAPLQRIAIVDVAPREQYLYPEFLLFERLFEAHGISVVIADPAELELRDGGLWHAVGRVDLVYNRITDFYLEDPAHATLACAYATDAAVITPHPHGHALYANKRNLALLTDAALLRRWGIDEATISRLIAGIPHTTLVTADLGDQLWRDRKRLFFKPARGFGSRGSYRGDKITRKVFADILQNDYVAQALVPPSERIARDDAHAPVLKVDLRNYVYEGTVLLIAARLYQGQTTNFRTPGGGFAPVFYPTIEGWCGLSVNRLP